MPLDAEACYRAVKSRDRRFDGVFYTGVRTTGIYCRPSCPALTPRRGNVAFYPSAAAAQHEGFRACRRCLPDATPGSPEWDVAADVAGRAMRLVADGVVERDGVEGLARRLGYSSRQLHRVVVSAYGAGTLALARSRRAQTARVLIETTELSFADVAFAAGFGSVRQFNDTVREVYASSPTELRGRRGSATTTPGVVETRIAVREPYDLAWVLRFLEVHVVAGVEAVGGEGEERWYERTVRLPHGHGVLRLSAGGPGWVACRFHLADARDLAPAMERTRRLLDADGDPVAVDEALGADPHLRPLVARRPGLRVPGGVDGSEVAVRTVLGQQVSLAGARTLAGRLVASLGEPLALTGGHAVTHLFPSDEALAGVDPTTIAMPRARGRALAGLCRALADGDVLLDRSADRDDVRRGLLALPGIGPWTADAVAMRALGDPDAFLPTDLGVRRIAERLGIDGPESLHTATEAWRPWRAYALMHLWALIIDPEESP